MRFNSTVLALAAALAANAPGYADIAVSSATREAAVRVGNSTSSASTSSTSGLSGLGAGAGGTSASASASLDSSIQPLQIAGTGAANLSVSQDANAFARSLMSVAFSLATPHSYVLTGETFTDAEAGNPTASFQLTGPATNLFFSGNSTIVGSGLLGPGSYQLDALARVLPSSAGGAVARASFTFQLDLTPSTDVPEPASLLTFGLVGAAGFVATRLRRRRDGRCASA